MKNREYKTHDFFYFEQMLFLIAFVKSIRLKICIYIIKM